ncbi:MAG: 4Fe-4S dicluster domain-containing protein [Lentisphaerae bacterium]|nr:4Fe-4S dicluster domain-containing protein [Lentisphaerota bacterium]MCP4101618.1 4Fe-4S dicluster domain-containing protein [Lentisphaerota bacterium]
MAAIVDKETCIGCEACVGECPVEAIEMMEGKADINDKCVDCGACVDICPVSAITLD